ncbi:nitroreductase family protein [Deferribacterales bacterium RsTz2092]|nr:NADH dehydrogenase [Deferribacterales bacterium]
MNAIDCIMTRRSIRQYKAGAIPDEDIKKILQAAGNAPSAANQQPWHFVVITDRDTLVKLSEILKFGKMLPQAACAVVICTSGAELTYKELAIDDCSAATQNILLAAHALGYGGVWLGVHHKAEFESAVKKLLAVPDGGRVYAAVSLGIPNEEKKSEANLKETMVHKNKW